MTDPMTWSNRVTFIKNVTFIWDPSICQSVYLSCFNNSKFT